MNGSPIAPRTRTLIAGLDPGHSKCGLVLADTERNLVLEAAILPPQDCANLLQGWQLQGLESVVVGNGTGSRRWREQLGQLHLQPELVNEHGSTLAARQRYWELCPPSPWTRLVPAGLRLPPRDIDDVVAQLLVERHRGIQLQRTSAAVQRTLTAPKTWPAR
ncbi:resolvase [Cyanobium sp. FACHB-13342]|uniref:resolvase n=1 Tax=Cyanobium sp. FACHB-13342 TaxID=2692793 RepID=UPI001680BD73|nr:resolvase [Cyanobium sp. FACHB-13342]MBD2422301.1 resolvase [Cyanobium sp. FACHB-13342]